MEANNQNNIYSPSSEKGFLSHHGILGMKWGIRRYQPYSTRGRLSGKGGKEIGEAAKKKYTNRARKAKEKSMKEDVKNRRLLNDQELAYKIERIKMERQLKTLTEKELSPGKVAVKNVLTHVGSNSTKTVLTEMTTNVLRKALISNIEKKNDKNVKDNQEKDQKKKNKKNKKAQRVYDKQYYRSLKEQAKKDAKNDAMVRYDNNA